MEDEQKIFEIQLPNVMNHLNWSLTIHMNTVLYTLHFYELGKFDLCEEKDVYIVHECVHLRLCFSI